MARILVLGANGMAGHVVSLYLRSVGHEVIGAGTQKISGICEYTFDVAELPRIGESYQLFNNDYDVVINFVALLVGQSQENPALAVLINSYFPQYLAQYFSESSTQLIQISTDEVFSGKPPFTEQALAKGNSRIYGRTKALGEVDNDKDLTLRISIIGPTLTPTAPSLLNWFLDSATTSLQGYSKAYWSGVTTLELVKALNYLISSPINGICHLAPEVAISKYQLLQLVNEILFKHTVHSKQIVQDKSVKLNRTMLSTRSDFQYQVLPFTQQLEQLKVWIDLYPDLYQHYF